MDELFLMISSPPLSAEHFYSIGGTCLPSVTCGWLQSVGVIQVILHT